MFNNQCDLKCQNEGHENGNILGVCTDIDCKNKRPYCLGCKFQFHEQHQKQLKKFEDLQNWVNENKIITQNLQKLLTEFKELVNLIQKSIDSTQIYFNSNFIQMNYTTLDDTINHSIKLWQIQKEMLYHLEQMMQQPATLATIQSIKASQQNQSNIMSNTQIFQSQRFNYRQIVISNQIQVQKEGNQVVFKQEQKGDIQNKFNFPNKIYNFQQDVKQNDGIIPTFNPNIIEVQKTSQSPFKKQYIQDQQPLDEQNNLVKNFKKLDTRNPFQQCQN